MFLHFSPAPPLLPLLSSSDPGSRDDGLASVTEEHEADDLRAMLLMFSVCHVIVFLHEGLRFDTQILKKFRMLQAAKHALAPFVRSQIALSSVLKPSSSLPQPAAPRATSASPPSRRGGVANRHALSLMSGSGSHPSVLPGQCTPIILFVFEDDFLDGPSPPLNAEDSSDASLNQSGMARPGSTLKGSGHVVMLARPMSKTEGSFRKKLHSSLEAQIRFLIKKCRILVATEPGNLGSRAAGNVVSLPLFSLDASRAVALLDRSMNQRGESLEFVTGLIEEALDSKAASDMSMLENHCQALNNEDIQLIKDYIYRQFDTLKGRGGLPSNPNSGSVAGVGMVAAAAAAAAASAAAGKLLSAPELPSLENWLSSSKLILDVLLSSKSGFVDKNESTKRLSSRRISTEMQDEQISQPGTNAVEAAVSCLESNKGLNMKFSLSWCQRALPVAKEVYLKELPACYPTALHKVQLEKALHAFHAMVKGPAVQIFAKKLEDECTLIWESGRQLCDAISLTGKPCMHQRHSVKACNLPSGAVVKQHSSGYVFLHACACGRSRCLREDPFDFDSANVTFNRFANCEDLLPTLVLPRGTSAGPLPSSSWNLVRLGGARYYKPSKGLLQIGFCSSEKFLLKWMISLEKRKGTSDLIDAVTAECNVISSIPDSKAAPIVDEQLKKSVAAQFPRVQPGGSENQIKSSEMVSADGKSISFGKGLPSFTMKKPFSEVVAGTVVADSTFPVLQHRKQPKTAPGKGGRQVGASDQTDDRAQLADDRHGSQKAEQVSVQESSHKPGTNCNTGGDPYLQIGSNIVPVNTSGCGKTKPNNSLKEINVYVGFEYECSYGHRFLLSLEHLKELDSSYSASEKSHSFSTEDSERKYVGSKNGLHEKVVPYSSETNMTAVDNMKKSNRSSETTDNISQQHDRFALFSTQGMEKFHFVHGRSVPSDSVEELEENLSHVRLDDGGSAFSLLNKNLPVYMNCPQCRSSATQDHQKIKFASTVSQLQRIFLVTPPFPTVLATCPSIQFEDSCLPASIPDREQQSRFSLGCQVILPPESFLTLRLPFVYGVQMDDGILHPLNHLENQPELTAWLARGTTLQVVSIGHKSDEEFYM